ncbi:c-type cytochrome [Actinomycetospora cinnamomea]|uniref:Cytochrome bc1 complex cytochrome c subunit n=1 Tax=Actinomycetospora cinnamomea TaxID=663609 RepID=A0A2U1F3X7_9PSEU|nr:c-type cytochrome [Actinomycetospora cinnamomea]PVZ06862.1 cbb3-type cytochrome c oxidase subunit III [Actinomycetospora cinnamomea]
MTPDEGVRPGRGRARRRFRTALTLAVMLVLMGGAYAWVMPEPVARAQDPALVREGEQLYEGSCITCHGADLRGIPGRAPSIVGAGASAAFFQLSTGRMPLAQQDGQAQRKAPRFTPQQIDALMAYVQVHGGGPVPPEERGAALVGEDASRGGHLFRLNCAQCHNFTGRGGALSQGKFAPPLDNASPEQVYTAMQSGPGAMPVFADTMLTAGEKRDIIAYVLAVRGVGENSPGGQRLGGFGPVSEGFVAFAVGMAALVGFTLWVGSRR